MKSRHLLVAALALAAAACQSPRPAQTTQTGQAQKQDPSAPVAKIGSQTITAGELDDVVKKDLAQLDQQYQEQRYQLRRQALEAMIRKRLVEEKAKAAGVPAEQLVQKEVASKIPEPSDEEIRALYDRAKAGGQPLPPLDQVKPEIARFIKNQKAQGALAEYYDKLKKDAKVDVLLPAYEPPKVAVAATGPSKGKDGAPVTIVEFSDFECPFCVRAEPTVKQVLDTYGDKVRLVYRDFPLPMHPKAPKAAEAAHCAGDQGKYWDMHAKLFSSNGRLDVPDLKKYAGELKLDTAKFDRCLDSGEKAKDVEANRKAGEDAGVTGTPAFFINGRPLSGAQPFDAFKAVIDQELQQAGKKS
jgi:protein-disulfide isomerase